MYFITLLSLSLYSYFLIDPDLTFFQTNWWVSFRNVVVTQGYYHRDTSWLIYLVIVIALFLLHYFFVKNYRKVNPIRLAIITAAVLLFSYPFLSHDFFNYMFDARILTFYHQNPYLHRALDFPNDPWLRFMQWTHRSYPYGPTFLLVSVIPSFLSFGKFVLNFFLFKMTFAFFYLCTVYLLQKIGRKWAVILATHPLILIEGLVSSHNDLIGLSLAVVGIFFLYKRKMVAARIFILLSAGIKYLTIPFIVLSRNNRRLNQFVFVVFATLLIYLSFYVEVQPWYFLGLFALLPFFENVIGNLNIFFAGLLISYYPYIRLGGWDTAVKVSMKHYIIGAFLVINFVQYIVFKKMKLRFPRSIFKSKS